MKVANDLSNVYIHTDAKWLVPMLAAVMMNEGKRGRKFERMSTGDAVSQAIREACAARGIEVAVKGKVGVGSPAGGRSARTK